MSSTPSLRSRSKILCAAVLAALSTSAVVAYAQGDLPRTTTPEGDAPAKISDADMLQAERMAANEPPSSMAPGNNMPSHSMQTAPQPAANPPATPTTTKAVAVVATPTTVTKKSVTITETTNKGANKNTTGAGAAVDPKPVRRLDEMGVFLRSQNKFIVKAASTTETVDAPGEKSQFETKAEVKVNRPNQLKAEIDSKDDGLDRKLYFDGRAFTIFTPEEKVFASVSAPGTISQLGEKAAQKYGVELPVADLFAWGSNKYNKNWLTAAVDLGPEKVDGVMTDHYAFRQAEIDWQIWIDKGDKPLPRKLMITTTTIPERPRHVVAYNWDLAPKFDADEFTFVPPKDARSIPLPEKSTGPTASRD